MRGPGAAWRGGFPGGLSRGRARQWRGRNKSLPRNRRPPCPGHAGCL